MTHLIINFNIKHEISRTSFFSVEILNFLFAKINSIRKKNILCHFSVSLWRYRFRLRKPVSSIKIAGA